MLNAHNPPAIVRAVDDQTMVSNAVVSEPPVKRSRRRRGKGGGSIKPVPDGLDLKQMKSRIPQGKLVVTFLSGLSPAAKGFALAYLLDQARKAQQAKAAQATPEQTEPGGGETC